MSLSVCVVDPSRRSTAVEEWGFGSEVALVTGRLGGPEVAARLREDLGGDARLVVLHRPADLDAAALVTNVVSGALPHLAVARLAVRSSLLGAAVIGLEAAHIENQDDGTRLARLAGTLGGTTSGAWLSRVTRLSVPSPSFGQHLRSLLPGGPRFLALLGPDAGVVRAAAEGYAGPPTRQLVIAAPPESTASQRLRAWYGSDDVIHVPPVVADARALYGNPGAEFIVVADSLAEAGPSRGACPVCGDVLHGDVCPFCHVHPRLVEETSA